MKRKIFDLQNEILVWLSNEKFKSRCGESNNFNERDVNKHVQDEFLGRGFDTTGIETAFSNLLTFKYLAATATDAGGPLWLTEKGLEYAHELQLDLFERGMRQQPGTMVALFLSFVALAMSTISSCQPTKPIQVYLQVSGDGVVEAKK